MGDVTKITPERAFNSSGGILQVNGALPRGINEVTVGL